MKLVHWKIWSLVTLALCVVVLAACGQVITNPTPTPVPTPTTAVTASPTIPPTSTPAPLTPLPTSTATITPTPIYYAVKQGDNLLSIAKTYGVTVESIQDANGILDPRRLQIGQELLIPVDENALNEPATPTATPMPYEIVGTNFQLSPSGRLWCLGAVDNMAGVDLEQVQVAVSLFDEKGEMLSFGTAFTELDIVPKGERAPFAVAFDSPPEKFATYQSVPLKGIPVTRLGAYYLDLEIVNHQGEARGRASYSVVGRVRNAGGKPAQDVRVVVTGYDQTGKVAAVRKVAPAVDELDPGRSSDFEINLLATAGTVVTYTLKAEALEKPGEGEAQ